MKPIIGLEVHAQVKTKTKMFCDCRNVPLESEPNTHICPICTAHPGTLPMPNGRAIEKVLLLGKALGSKIDKYSRFDRKHYFYPDLPKGYQISQYEHPLCDGGDISFPVGETDEIKDVKITRVHLEEDTGKLSHAADGKHSLVDFNRAGIPLMELVTEPVIENGQQARSFCDNLQLLLRYLNISDADMEKGQMRCEVNISMTDAKGKWGTKVEIKNLNSFRAVEKSIDFEIERQTKLLKDGKEVVQETRGWDDNKLITKSQRAKEDAHDYRYFPDPDLPPLTIEKRLPEDGKKKNFHFYLEEIHADIPELPWEKRERFAKEYKLDKQQIEVFVRSKEIAGYFESVASEIVNWDREDDTGEKLDAKHFTRLYRLAANYILTELAKMIIDANQPIKDLKITPENFAELMIMLHHDKISSSAGQQILKTMFETGDDPSIIADREGLVQESDIGKIEEIVDTVIKDFSTQVEQYKSGQDGLMQFLVGQVMRISAGSANPKLAKELLEKKLSS